VNRPLLATGIAVGLVGTLGKLAVGVARVLLGLDEQGAGFMGWRRA